MREEIDRLRTEFTFKVRPVVLHTVFVRDVLNNLATRLGIISEKNAFVCPRDACGRIYPVSLRHSRLEYRCADV